jgi:hypothetical protein
MNASARKARLALLASAGLMILAALGCSGKNASGGGGEGGAGGEGAGGSGPVPSACKASDFTPWAKTNDSNLLSLGSSKKGVTALISTDKGLTLVRAGGESVLLAPITPDHLRYTGKLFSRSDGSICAAFVDDSMSKKGTLQIACDDGKAPTDTKLVPDSDLGGETPLAPIEGDTPGDTYVYGMDFAAVALFVGNAMGWSKQELYESSISYPGNVVRVGGNTIACVIGTFGLPKLANYNEVDWAVEKGAKASDCRVATDGTSLFVTEDNRFAKLPSLAGGPFTTTPVPGLVDQHFLSLVAYKGKALGLTSDRKLIDPATGTQDAWAIPDGANADMILDAASGALTVGVIQGDQLVVGTKCLQ